MLIGQLKIYLKSRVKHLGKQSISKAILIQWDKKDHLAEDNSSMTFSTDIKVEVWELQKNMLHKIWSYENNN